MLKYKITLLAIVLLMLTNCKSGKISYPVINKSNVVDNYHGQVITDPYRNIENLKDSTVLNWFEEQKQLTKTYLDTLSSISEYYNLMKGLDNRVEEFAMDMISDENNTIYYIKKVGESKYYNLYSKKDGEKENLLYKPEEYKKDSGVKYGIYAIKPSYDGKYILLFFKSSGDFTGDLVVFDTTENRILDEIITNTSSYKYNGLSWMPDSKSFLYLGFPVIEKGKKGYKSNSYTKLHTIGQNPENDTYVFGSENIDCNPSYFAHCIVSSSKDKYVFGYLAHSSDFIDSYYTTTESMVNGNPEWKPFYTADYKVNNSEGILYNNRYYYLEAKTKTNYQIASVALDAIDFDNPRIEVPAYSDKVITDFSINESGIYYITNKNGVDQVLRFKNNLTDSIVELPSKGGVSFFERNIYKTSLLIEVDGWNKDLLRYELIDGKIQEQILIAAYPDFHEFNDINVTIVDLPGHDGVLIPVTIIHKGALGKISLKSAFIESYGAFGTSKKPYFHPSKLVWVSEGDIWVIAHIRGGGEKGVDWHEAGRKNTKSNSWKDLISVTEYLISKEYTTKEKTILSSSSAGVIGSAMAVNTRPDLFKVLISRVPIANPVRTTAGSYKKTSFIEYGDINDPKEAKHLIAMDPYLNILPNTKYPATMVIPSSRDDRLDLWHSGKYIARLQECQIGDSPILLDVNLKAGHTNSSMTTLSKIYGFAKYYTSN